MQKWLLSGVILLAFLLRIVAIDKYPVGLNPDETSFGYDAYSLLKTGHDQWGHAWPLSLESFGDYKIPLYSYLAIPTVAIFGLNEFSTRLPNALFGVLAVLATYLMVQEVFKNRKLALASAFLLAISPWHVFLSRGAFEANLTTFFIPFSIWLFYKGLQKPKFLYWSALFFGLNLFTYHSARLVTPLIVFVLWVINYRQASFKKLLLPASIFVVFGIVALWTMVNGGATRGADIAISNPTDHGEAIFQRRNQADKLNVPDQLSRLFSNKFTYTFAQFEKNYFTYFSPQFLFTQGPQERTFGMIPGLGVMYLIEVVFVGIASIKIIQEKDRGKWVFIFLWLLLAPIPAALAKGNGFAANRAAIMMPALQIISAYGLLFLWENYKKLRYMVIGLIIFSFIFVSEEYLYHMPIDSASSMMYGRKQMVLELKRLEPNYNHILVSRSLSEPHIYFAFFDQWDPKDYQSQTKDWERYKTEGRSFLDQLGEYSLGKYTFTSIDFEQNSKEKNILLVGQPSEFPKNINTQETITDPSGKPVILIVDPTKISYALR